MAHFDKEKFRRMTFNGYSWVGYDFWGTFVHWKNERWYVGINSMQRRTTF